MIQAKNVCFSYRNEKPVLNGLSLQEEKGHMVAVLGNNGAGKSTFLKCIDGLFHLSDGSILVCGRETSRMKRAEFAKMIAYVEQRQNTYDATVFDTVLLGRKPYIKFEPGKEDIRIVSDVLERLELSDLAVRSLKELSGGEMQKVAIARALAQQPEILLLDEPTSNLDIYNQHEVMELAQQISREDNMLVMVVIHDLNLALKYCDRFLFLKDGKEKQYGGREIVTDELISEIYGVKARVLDINGQSFVIVD